MQVNGKEFSWGQVNVVLPGKNIAVDGITEISYGEKQEKKPFYARGFKPKFIGSGQKDYTGNVKLLQSEFEAIQRALGTGKTITDIRNATVTVTYGNIEDTFQTTDQLIGVEFGEWKKGMKTGDTAMEIDIPMFALDVLLNVS